MMVVDVKSFYGNKKIVLLRFMIIVLCLGVQWALAQEKIEKIDTSMAKKLSAFEFSKLEVPRQRVSERIDIKIERCEEDYSIDDIIFYSSAEEKEYTLNEHPILAYEILPVFQNKYSMFKNYVGSMDIALYKEPRVFLPEALVVIRKLFLATYSFYDSSKRVSQENKDFVRKSIGDLVNVTPGLGSKFSLSCQMLMNESNKNTLIEQLTIQKSARQVLNDLWTGQKNNSGIEAYSELIGACNLGTEALNDIRYMIRTMLTESIF